MFSEQVKFNLHTETSWKCKTYIGIKLNIFIGFAMMLPGIYISIYLSKQVQRVKYSTPNNDF